ncbi:MAG: transketolase [Candidatus Cloacimonetes bacterium]|jgi:transketolase|nr:transketolase [Candidatus Cloacimonadota bacterium]MDD4156067.1 transketolase [Candidatus Cloacimonadota bacterium]
MDYSLLDSVAKNIRKKIIESIYIAGSGHPGGSLSAVEIGTALYFNLMNHNPKNPNWEDRDRFILSKGHAAPLLYSLLSEAKYFSENELFKLRKLNSSLQGHPNSLKCPGVDISTGSLGQGLSIACGMAMFAKMNNKDFYIYSLHGDGELNEGQIWEALMFAGHHKLNNMIAFIDRNLLQLDGKTEEILQLEPLKDKFISFGWNCLCIDGHSFKEIIEAVNNAKKCKLPTAIIAKTIKGKGVSFMENQVGWHGKAPNKDELLKAIKEIDTL